MIKLRRTVHVRSIDCEATIALGIHRPEFLAVAQLAEDLERPIDAKDVSRELLGRLPVHVGGRVLDRAVHLGLLERATHRGPAHLSDLGRAALERGMVLVPQEGVFRLHWAVDPLLDPILLHVEPLESPKAKDVKKQLRRDKDRGVWAEDGDDLPRPLRSPTSDQALRTSVVDGRPFVVREVASKVERGPESRLELRLQWGPAGEPRVSMIGALQRGDEGRHRVDSSIPDSARLAHIAYDDLWMELVARGSGASVPDLEAWQQRAGSLVVPRGFDAAAADERKTFMANLDVPAGEVLDLGPFDATRIDNQPLVPASDSDAQQWIEWLQWDALTTYATPASLEQTAAALSKQFPLHRPAPLEPDEMLREALAAPRGAHSRYLCAPYDLGLWS